MKPLVKLVISLGIKIAFIYLLVAIVEGLTGGKLYGPIEYPAASVCVEATELAEETTSESLVKAAQTAEIVVSEPAEQQTIPQTQNIELSSEISDYQASSTPCPEPAASAPSKHDVKPSSNNKVTPGTAASDPDDTSSVMPTETPDPTNTPSPEPLNSPSLTPKPVNDPKYTRCIADVEYWAGNDNCYHGIVCGVECRRNKAGRWVITNDGESMVWDAIEAEHPDYGGYSSKIIRGTERDFS